MLSIKCPSMININTVHIHTNKVTIKLDTFHESYINYNMYNKL